MPKVAPWGMKHPLLAANSPSIRHHDKVEQHLGVGQHMSTLFGAEAAESIKQTGFIIGAVWIEFDGTLRPALASGEPARVAS